MSGTDIDFSLVERIEDRLQRIANVLLLNASFIDNPGLLNGKMGIAIFFYHYAKYTTRKIYKEYADELIDEIYEDIITSTPVNFENGLTGIGWGIEYLVKNNFVEADTDEALEEVDNMVYRNSLYRPFLLDSGNDIFGYGLYYLIRLRQNGSDNSNLKTLFKKQHLIYLTDDCERILVHKKFLDYKIDSLGLDAINSFAWFLIEMHRWIIFPYKIEKVFHALPEYFESCLQRKEDIAGKTQLCKFIGLIILCVKDVNIKNVFRKIGNSNKGQEKFKKTAEDTLVDYFIKEAWQQMIYEPHLTICEQYYRMAENVFQFIDNDESWNERLDNLNKNNLGLTGLAGLGLGLLFSIMKK